MKLKDIISSLTAKFAALVLTFGLAAGAWAEGELTMQYEEVTINLSTSQVQNRPQFGGKDHFILQENIGNLSIEPYGSTAVTIVTNCTSFYNGVGYDTVVNVNIRPVSLTDGFETFTIKYVDDETEYTTQFRVKVVGAKTAPTGEEAYADMPKQTANGIYIDSVYQAGTLADLIAGNGTTIFVDNFTGDITIPSGRTVTLNSTSNAHIGTIVNNGTLTLDGSTATSMVNNGTLTLKGSVVVTEIVNNNILQFASATATTPINVTADRIENRGTLTKTSGYTTVTASNGIYNYGTMTDSSTIGRINGDITNYQTLEIKSYNSKAGNQGIINGTITNFGTFTVAASTTSSSNVEITGKIYNNYQMSFRAANNKYPTFNGGIVLGENSLLIGYGSTKCADYSVVAADEKAIQPTVEGTTYFWSTGEIPAYVAQTPSGNFETFAEAWTNVMEHNGGSSIALMADVTLNEILNDSAYTRSGGLHLYLNGHTLTVNANSGFSFANDWWISSSSTAGTIVINGDNLPDRFSIGENGKLTIVKGKVNAVLGGETSLLEVLKLVYASGYTVTNDSTNIYVQRTSNVPAVVHVDSIALDKTEMTLAIGETNTLTATISPANATEQFVVWSAGDINIAGIETPVLAADIATIKVFGQSAGTAYISARPLDWGEENPENYVCCTVTVTRSSNFYQDTTDENVFHIANLAGLQEFRNEVNAGNSFAGKTVVLDVDIDMSSISSWDPIGQDYETIQGGDKLERRFAGTFDGNNKTLSNLTINDNTHNEAGLFGITGYGSTFRDLTLDSPTVNGRVGVGTLAGKLWASSVINCHVTGDITVTGYNSVGGLAGSDSYTDITDCSVIGDDKATSVITGNYVEGIEDGDNIGGLVGMNGPSDPAAQKADQATSGCSVGNLTLRGWRKVGGLSGQSYNRESVYDCSVGDIDIICLADTTFAAAKEETLAFGGMVGIFAVVSDDTKYRHAKNSYLEGTVSNVTITCANDAVNAYAKMGIISGGQRGNNEFVEPTDTQFNVTVSGTNSTSGTKVSDNTDKIYSAKPLVDYVTLALTIDDSYAADYPDNVAAARAMYEGVKYESLAAAQAGFAALFGWTGTGYANPNNAPFKNAVASNGPTPVTKVTFDLYGTTAVGTSDGKITLGNFSASSLYLMSVDLVGHDGAEISGEAEISAKVAGGYDNHHTTRGKFFVTNIVFTTSSDKVEFYASCANIDAAEKVVEPSELEVVGCTFHTKVYEYSNSADNGKMTYSFHDNVFISTGSETYALHIQSGTDMGPDTINFYNNIVSNYVRGININVSSSTQTKTANIYGNTFYPGVGYSAVQLSTINVANIHDNTICLNAGNAITLHELLYANAEVNVLNNTIEFADGANVGYIVYDDAQAANNTEALARSLTMTYTGNTVATGVSTTQGVKGSNVSELRPYVYYVLNGIVAGVVTSPNATPELFTSIDAAITRADEVGVDEVLLLGNGAENTNSNWKAGEGNTLVRKVYVAQIGTTKYETLASAISAASAGDTVKLLTDVTLTGQLVSGESALYGAFITKSITLDGNNHTIVGSNCRAIGVKGVDANNMVDVTFKNLTVTDASSNAICICTRGNIEAITLDNVTLDTTGCPSGYNQPLTIGGTQSSAAKVDIKNGSVIKTNDQALNYYAIIVWVPVDMTIDHSTVKGWACVYMKSGSAGSTVEITDSTLVSVGLSGSTDHFAALVTEADNVTMNVTGTEIDITAASGTYQGIGLPSNKSGVSIELGAGNNVTLRGDMAVIGFNMSQGDVTVSGGTFNKAVSDYYCAEGYIPVAQDSETGLYTVKEGVYRAQILEDGYVTISAPITEASDDVYLDMWGFWNMKGMVDASGNECPQYVAITDNTMYRDLGVASDHAEAWVSAKYIYDNYLAPGKTLYGYQTYYLYEIAPVAKAKFESLQAAIDAAANGDTVQLLADVGMTDYFTTSSTRFPISKSLVIDGQGHSITVGGRGFGVGLNASSKIDVTFKDVTIANSSNGARCIDTRGNLNSLTLNHVTLDTNGASGYTQPLTIGGNQSDKATVSIVNGSKIQTNDEGTAYYAIITFNPVNMTIDDSTIKGWACIYAKGPDGSAGSAGSVFTITDSELVSKNKYSGTSNAFAMLMAEDDNVTFNVTNTQIDVNATGDQHQAIVATGSSSQATGVAANLGEGNEVTLSGNATFESNMGSAVVSGGTFNVAVPEEVCADGFIPAAQDPDTGKYTVKTGSYVAQNATTGVKYETLAEALANAANGDTVTMLDNVTLTEPLNVALGAKVVTLDLGGKTLAGRTNLKSGSLTIKNGTVAGGSAQALNVYGSADTTATNYSVLTIASDVNVTADVYGVCMFGATAGSNGYGAVVNIAGTVTTTGDDKNGAVFVSGNLGQNVSDDAHNVINVTGKITSATDAAIAMNGLATVNVSAGAEVTGNTAIAVKRGTLNVTDGTIHATGAKNYTAAAYYNGTEMTGAAISVSATYSKYGALAVNVSGGTVTSDNADAIFKQDGTYQSDATVAVSGGYFSSVVSATYCATGCLCTTAPMANGYYQVVPAATVTFVLDGNAPADAVKPENMIYPSDNPAKTALPMPTYTFADKTFAGWKVNGEGDAVSALPAGTTDNVTLTATWIAAEKVEVEIGEGTEAAKVEAVIPDDFFKDKKVFVEEQEVPVQTAEQKSAYLETVEDNGIKVWQNYVMGIDGRESSNKLAPIGGEPKSERIVVVKTPVETFTPPTADTGVTVKYALYWRAADSATWTQYGDFMDAPTFGVDIVGDITAAETYWKIEAVFTASSATATETSGTSEESQESGN